MQTASSKIWTRVAVSISYSNKNLLMYDFMEVSTKIKLK